MPALCSSRASGGLTLATPKSPTQEVPSKPRSFFAYRVLCRLLRFATRIFFRNIEVVGRVTLPNPENSAVIFCGNHPNSLLDPVLITAWSGRIVHFAAKAPLFSVPILGTLLRIMGAVAIRRRQDHGGGDHGGGDQGGGKQCNEDAFHELENVLLEGRAMGIFPEGISHDESQLVPLKTGAARIALATRARNRDLPIYIVPVGLVYFTRHRFRSSVLVQFGTPILVPAAAAEPANTSEEKGDEDAVRAITKTLDERLRSLTINAETWEHIWVLDGVRRLYQPEGIDLNERARLARLFNETYPKVADQADIIKLYDSVRSYLLRLSADNLHDALIAKGLTPLQIALHVAAHLALLFVSLPLFLIGAPLFLPIGLTLKVAGVFVSPRSDTVATTKFVLGFLGIGGLYIGISVWAFLTHGTWLGLLVALVIPASGGAVIHVIARMHALRNLATSTYRIFTLRREIAELRAERKQLVLRVAVLVDKYRGSVLN